MPGRNRPESDASTRSVNAAIAAVGAPAVTSSTSITTVAVTPSAGKTFFTSL